MDQETVQNAMQMLTTVLTSYGLQVIGAIIILIVGRIVAAIACKLVRRAMGRARADAALIGFTCNLVRVAVMAFAVIAALAKFGVQTTSFVAVLGAAGLAVGLALQGSLANFAAGVLILLFRPFRIDDVIDVADTLGKVAEIGIFTTTINTPDNRKVIIPNAQVTGGTITNINAHDTRRVDLTAGIGYADDVGRAKEVLEGILAQHDKVLAEPESTVQVVELADSSVNFVVRPWVKTADYWDVYFDVTRSIKEEFDRQGISIPFPQQDVHMHQVAEG